MMMKLTWGDTVRVSKDAPSQFRPGESGSICGFRDLDENSEEIHSEILARLCVVEFANGTAIEVPEIYLAKIG